VRRKAHNRIPIEVRREVENADFSNGWTADLGVELTNGDLIFCVDHSGSRARSGRDRSMTMVAPLLFSDTPPQTLT
jgi:hypothetical protein